MYINSRKASIEDASELWGKVEAIDKQKFSKVVKEAGENMRRNKVVQEGLAKFGTLAMVPMAQVMGIAVVHSYSKGVM